MQQPPRENSFPPKSPMHWRPRCSLIPSTFPACEPGEALPGHHFTAVSPGSIWPRRGFQTIPVTISVARDAATSVSTALGQSRLKISHLSLFRVFQPLSAVVWELRELESSFLAREAPGALVRQQHLQQHPLGTTLLLWLPAVEPSPYGGSRPWGSSLGSNSFPLPALTTRGHNTYPQVTLLRDGIQHRQVPPWGIRMLRVQQDLASAGNAGRAKAASHLQLPPSQLRVGHPSTMNPRGAPQRELGYGWQLGHLVLSPPPPALTVSSGRASVSLPLCSAGRRGSRFP